MSKDEMQSILDAVATTGESQTFDVPIVIDSGEGKIDGHGCLIYTEGEKVIILPPGVLVS